MFHLEQLVALKPYRIETDENRTFNRYFSSYLDSAPSFQKVGAWNAPPQPGLQLMQMVGTSLKVRGIASVFAAQAMTLQTLLWIRLVLIFTLLSQKGFAPPMQFSLSCMVFHSMIFQIPKCP